MVKANGRMRQIDRQRDAERANASTGANASASASTGAIEASRAEAARLKAGTSSLIAKMDKDGSNRPEPAETVTPESSAIPGLPSHPQAGQHTDLSADPLLDPAFAAFLPALMREWSVIGRPEQQPPQGDWRTWLVMGGRGSGKTRAGAEWVHALASAGRRSDLRIALVAETLGDAREVMIDGLSGICRIARRNRPDFEITRRRLVWPNGAIAQIFSSEDPEALRGPQFHFAWCDELGKWKHAEETFDMLQFGLRLGQAPQQMVTTTPRPVPLLKRLIADPATRLVRIATTENAANLAPGFVAALERRYGGTRLGRQELAGELIEDRSDALWRRADLEAAVIRFSGPLRRIVVAVDPPSGMGEQSCCGIVVAGVEAKREASREASGEARGAPRGSQREAPGWQAGGVVARSEILSSGEPVGRPEGRPVGRQAGRQAGCVWPGRQGWQGRRVARARRVMPPRPEEMR